ncbi:hypothetical protein Gogos_005414 [Gossypium gossypioides]|uniref:Uncharacterized protein n=1 Tax=Gossypium gossypioides TaxID=34282 RepID=A0A7J9D7G6_GOSGO|nr:hypothetical protein [Gossypium gossypioides]
MGKANGVRHLSLFAFVVYGLIMFQKALGYVFVPSNRPIEEFLESEWPPNEWVQNLSTLTYQEIEWRAPWMIRSTILIGYDQYVPTTAGFNRVEVFVQDPRFWRKLEEIRIKWVQNKEVTKEYIELAEHFVTVEQMAVS